jgi:hypothetical protein
MGSKYMKKCSTFLPIKEIHIEIKLRLHFTSFRMTIIKNTTAGKDGGRERILK